MNIDIHLEDKCPHIICPVDDPIAVEQAINPLGWCVGDAWWSSDPEQEQEDGRWLLYVSPLSDYDLDDATLNAEAFNETMREVYGAAPLDEGEARAMADRIRNELGLGD